MDLQMPEMNGLDAMVAIQVRGARDIRNGTGPSDTTGWPPFHPSNPSENTCRVSGGIVTRFCAPVQTTNSWPNSFASPMH